jgi:hypothetical protein
MTFDIIQSALRDEFTEMVRGAILKHESLPGPGFTTSWSKQMNGTFAKLITGTGYSPAYGRAISQLMNEDLGISSFAVKANPEGYLGVRITISPDSYKKLPSIPPPQL